MRLLLRALITITIFPGGIHIGYIEKVYVDDSSLFQYADIIPRATSGLLDFLFIVSEGKK